MYATLLKPVAMLQPRRSPPFGYVCVFLLSCVCFQFVLTGRRSDVLLFLKFVAILKSEPFGWAYFVDYFVYLLTQSKTTVLS